MFSLMLFLFLFALAVVSSIAYSHLVLVRRIDALSRENSRLVLMVERLSASSEERKSNTPGTSSALSAHGNPSLLSIRLSPAHESAAPLGDDGRS